MLPYLGRRLFQVIPTLLGVTLVVFLLIRVHSRNGSSRARMAAGRAREFGDELGALLALHCEGDTVSLSVVAPVVWARPAAS